jgi:hypothetical protein
MTDPCRPPTSYLPIMSEARKLVTLGLFIIDEFAFLDTTGKPTGRRLSPQEEYTSLIGHVLARLSQAILFSASDWRRWHLCQRWRSHLVRFRIPLRNVVFLP